MQDIADAGVAQGFKRQRAIWEAAKPGEFPTTTGEGKAEIPAWAKKIIKPIKKNLRPILKQIKQVNISEWFQSVWSKHIVPFVTKQIPKVWDWIRKGVKWLRNNAGPIFEKVRKAVVDLSTWFEDNFQGEFDEAMGNLEEIFTDMGLGGLEKKLGDLKDALETKAENLIATLATIGGAIVGALVGQYVPMGGPFAVAAVAAIGGLIGNALVNDEGIWGAIKDAIPGLQEGGWVEGTGIAEVHKGEIIGEPSQLAGLGQQNINVRLDIDGRELNSRLSDVDRRDEYNTHGSTRGKKGGYGRN